METKDHLALAVFLVNRQNGQISRLQRAAFIAGNVEPDFNPFTYLHGFVHHKHFQGHHYANVYDTIVRLNHKLKRCSIKNARYYYLQGKLMHYVADIFTFPHNEIFAGSIAEHCAYEDKLHLVMREVLALGSEAPYVQVDVEHFMESVTRLHQQYLSEKMQLHHDSRYILQAAAIVVNHSFVREEMYENGYVCGTLL